VTPDVVIRPLAPADVPAAQLAAWSALEVFIPAEHRDADEDAATRRGQARIAHVLDTDPEGAWVAVVDDAVAGVALAFVREGIWGLSLFAMAPEHQGKGIGTRLLGPALAYADGARGALILSSADPRAMRRYARAGFGLRPCVAAGGMLDRAALPSGLAARSGDLARDLELCDTVSRAVRGAAHGTDLPNMLAYGGELHVVDGRGFAVGKDDAVWLLAATDEEAARDLLWSCLAATRPGASIHVDFITAGQDWAIGVVLDAGFALSPDGPLFVRGETGPLTPYLPSGAYL
jgi:GNAT superfamily N-acetyltransferase